MTPQKKATVVSSLTATALVVIKIFVAILSGSVAVLASAIDSLLDMFVSIFNFFALNKAEESPNKTYQYGKGKIQALAALLEGTIISLSGVYIIYAGIDKMINSKETTLLTPSIIVMGISIVITWFLVQYLLKVAKETDNIVIKADALHYKTDLVSNGAVLAALVLVYFTSYDIFDSIIGIGIGVFIIYSAFEIIIEGIEILLDKSLEEGTVSSIEEIISKNKELTSYHWLRTRTDGTTNYVEFHMVLWPNIPLIEAHRISEEIEDEISMLDDKRNWVITPHFDPYDDEHINDSFLNGRASVRIKNTKSKRPEES